MLIYHAFIQLLPTNMNEYEQNRHETYIKNVQKQALIMVANDMSSGYQELSKFAKTGTQETRLMRQLVNEVYKAMHKLTS